MKKILFSLLLICVSVAAFSQTDVYYITGKVIDKATRAPLASASVYAQNTTFGTVTDSAGNFRLKLPNGGYDLAVTYTGYETDIKRITTADAVEKNRVVELSAKIKEMDDVAIVSGPPIVKDGWVKYGQFFLDNFIGTTKFGQACVLENHEVLKFYFSKKRNRLKVLATEPLIIDNTALGYKITYALDSFVNEYNTEVSLYSGSPLYAEMQPQNDAQKRQWQDNRVHAYKGSMLHFMKSFYNKTLQENGFEVQYLLKNNGNDSAIRLKDYYTGLNYDKDDSAQIVEITPNMPDVIVLYTKEKPGDDYLKASGDTHTQDQLSIITIAPQKAIDIEQNGYYYDQNDITISGYWTWRKAGDALPYDFNP
ncbi:MAG TPA: carboxypeptidase-like regulatory domain-containing protein [Ferruginibacter sp.]|nr:carboxypeptidase-like regulatory domain-containing protein [Ferruginibacter sp.]